MSRTHYQPDEVDVAPGEPEELALPQAGEQGRRQKGAVGLGGGAQEGGDLPDVERPHFAPFDRRPLSSLQASDRVLRDHPAPCCVAENPTEDGERLPNRSPCVAGLAHPRDDLYGVVLVDFSDPQAAERRQLEA